MPRKPCIIMNLKCFLITGKSFLKCLIEKGNKINSAADHLKKFKVTGDISLKMPRPITKLPDQKKVVRTRSKYARNHLKIKKAQT